MPKSPNAQDRVVLVPNCAIPQMKHKDDTSSRKTKQDVNRVIPIYPGPVYQPLPKPVKIPIPDIPGSLSDIDPELNIIFEENSPFQEGVIMEMYQRLDKSYCQELKGLESLVKV